MSILAANTAHPTQYHMILAMRILSYVKTTQTLGITFTSDGPIQLFGHADASYNCHDDARSHTGLSYTIGTNTAAFHSRSSKQKNVTRSSTEAELYALDSCVTDIVWFRSLLKGLGYEQNEPTTVYEDNKSTIHLTENDGNFQRTKHFNMRYQYIREAVNENIIKVVYVPTEHNMADILTKEIGNTKLFFHLRALLLNTADTESGYTT